MDNPWPAGVPLSLWTYGDLRPDALAQVPMMGIKFAPGFLYAFAFGCIFIAVFSWKRFLVKPDVRSVSRPLGDLSPGDIGGHGALIRAYFIYCGTVLLLYISLTFFGRLILQSTQMIPVAGIQMDVDKLKFDSAQWPLMLAFAFAGLAEMLPPIRMTEGWLRNRAYRAVGIPVRLEQTMRNLIDALDSATNAPGPARDDLSKRLAGYRADWARTLARHPWTSDQTMQRLSRHDEMLNLLAQLELLIAWAKTARGKWPGHEVSATVRGMEQDYVREASDLLDALHKRMSETPAKLASPQAGDDLRNRQARFAAELAGFAARAETLRLDLVGILAIYLERDPDSPSQETDPGPESAPEGVRIDAALHRLLLAADRQDSAGVGPEAGLFLALLVVFAFYAAAAWRGLVEPIGTFVETSNVYGVLATALVETLRIAALTWLPLLAAFSLRQYLWDNGDWAGAARAQRRSGYAMQIFACLCLAVTVSVLALMAVGALKAFFVAPTPSYFFSLYVGGKPFILYFPSQAVILVVLIPMALLSADLRKSAAMRLWYGLGCALGVILLSVYHLDFWNPALAEQCPGLSMLSSAECARNDDLAGHLVLGVLAFLAAGVLGDLPERVRSARPRWLPDQAVAAVLLAALALWPAPPAQAQAVSGEPARALPSPGRATQTHRPQQIVMAMRRDAPPFSYLPEGEDPSQPTAWRGYVADLCLDIFAGQDQFRVTLRPVTAANRLHGLNLPISHKDHVDILCDATTMRFSDPLRSDRAVFSPIVFVSGVSYLDKIQRSMRSGILLGYIAGSTASTVAFKTCEIDHFNAMIPAERKILYQRCKLRWIAAEAHYALANPDAAPLAVKKRLNDLADAADRLREAVQDQGLDRLDPGTRRLMNAVLGEPDPADARKPRQQPQAMLCRDGLDARDTPACRNALALLADASCAATSPQPPSQQSIADRNWPDYHFCPQTTHEELIEWFCAGPSDQRRIYMGDRELILDRLQSWNARRGPCTVEQPDGAEFLSYEPYALPISVFRPRLIQFVQRRVYGLFSRRAEMDARFAGNFPGRRMSSTLAYLFLLNAVEDEATLLPSPSPLRAPWENAVWSEEKP